MVLTAGDFNVALGMPQRTVAEAAIRLGSRKRTSPQAARFQHHLNISLPGINSNPALEDPLRKSSNISIQTMTPKDNVGFLFAVHCKQSRAVGYRRSIFSEDFLASTRLNRSVVEPDPRTC